MEISPIENIKPGLRRSRAILLFTMGVSKVQPGVPENRCPPVRQNIPGGTDAIFSYIYGDHSANV